MPSVSTQFEQMIVNGVIVVPVSLSIEQLPGFGAEFIENRMAPAPLAIPCAVSTR